MSTIMDQAIISATTLATGLAIGFNLQHSDSIDKCVAAYYSARKADEYPRSKEAAQNATFTACMKTEYARAFSKGAQKVVKIEEFKEVTSETET